MTDLIERTLHRLGEQRPGQISRPGDEDYAGGDSDLGEASRLHATRGQPPRAAYVRSPDKGTHLGLSATPKRRPRRLLHGKAGRRIARAPSVLVRPPRVARAPVAMECALEREFTVGDFNDHVVWGRVVRFHLRDDIFNAKNSYVDTAALAPVGRLAAEYTLVDNVFTTPLEPRTLREREGARMHRIDGRPSDWAAVNQKNWSPSGSILD